MKESNITIYGHGSGHPSKKNLAAYNTKRNASRADNGKSCGVVEVRRLKSLTDKEREMFEKLYRTILGRNIYSQAKRNYVYEPYKADKKYYSDCSSSGMATLKKAGAWDGVYLNTAGIHTSKYFETVPVKIVSGHITNPEILKVGDAILYRGNNPSRPLQIGHVEWVAIVPEEKEEKKSDTSSGKTTSMKKENKSVKSAKYSDKNYSKKYMTTANVNMRYGPGKDKYDVIKVVKKGVSVRCYKYYDKAADGSIWLLVSDGKTSGYIKKDLLK